MNIFPNYEFQSLQPPMMCTPDTTSVYMHLKNMQVDWSKVPHVDNISLVTKDGWYKLSIGGYLNLYVAMYVDKTSDTNYNYIITIVNIDHMINMCENISIKKTDKKGVLAPNTTIPSNVMAKAVSTFPSTGTTCGTGLWDGCTAGIKNQYLIVGGVAVLGLYFMSK